MATSAEQVFYAAVVAAEATRQQARADAMTTYGYVPANLTAYRTAISDADVAYYNAVKAAQDTSNLTLGTLGMEGPIRFALWASTNVQ